MSSADVRRLAWIAVVILGIAGVAFGIYQGTALRDAQYTVMRLAEQIERDDVARTDLEAQVQRLQQDLEATRNGLRHSRRETQELHIRLDEVLFRATQAAEIYAEHLGLQDDSARRRCADHLRQLGALWVMDRMESGAGRPRWSGVAYFLSFRMPRRVIARGQEGIFICPGDGHARAPTSDLARSFYDDVDLSAPGERLCSYVVRDFKAFPLRVDSPDLQVIAADRQGSDHRTPHHVGGINVLFEDGSVTFYDHAALGLEQGEPIAVGPESSHPMLRVLIYAEPRKD